MTKLNAIQCAIHAREELNMAMSFVVTTVSIEYVPQSSVPRYHKDHIADPEDGDNFVCHTCYKDENTNSIDKMPHNVDVGDMSQLYMLATLR